MGKKGSGVNTKVAAAKERQEQVASSKTAKTRAAEEAEQAREWAKGSNQKGSKKEEEAARKQEEKMAKLAAKKAAEEEDAKELAGFKSVVVSLHLFHYMYLRQLQAIIACSARAPFHSDRSRAYEMPPRVAIAEMQHWRTVLSSCFSPPGLYRSPVSTQFIFRDIASPKMTSSTTVSSNWYSTGYLYTIQRG